MKIKDNKNDYADLKKAVELLETPSITARISNLIGSPIEYFVAKLPKSASKKINGIVVAAMNKSASAALWSLENEPGRTSSTKINKLYAAASGAAGGAFGFFALGVELPIATTIMMRAVADVARSEGFDLDDFDTKQACIEVFALGGNSNSDDSADTGYYAVRGFTTQTMQALSKELAELATKQTTSGLQRFTAEQSGKWLATLIEKVAARFGIVVTEKFAAQAVPIVGAVTGASINLLFTDFYQDMARGHFIVKRLENSYGFDDVKKEYQRIKGPTRDARA
ncbi:EcsC family protein [Xanthomonas arboricola]|uniref:EcsC family protein n=1 Tax=Xanthomonas arboricola TaxID=56448 RepID=UPI000F8E33A8|nr:EcsC family protein [Xanthomonas arboricola]